MKLRGISYIIIALGVMLTACEVDNYEPPKSILEGHVVYQDQPVGVRSNGVQLELWQPGFELFQKIPVYVAYDGSFSAALFDGDYKLVRLRGNGPWVDNTDTIDVQVRGNTVIDVPVEPYYTVSNETFQASGNTVAASFTIDQVNASRELERVTLYIGTTAIVDVNNSIVNVSLNKDAIADLNAPINLSLELPPNLSGRDYVFARIGVKTSGVEEMLYSPVQKIEL
ncbi:DUF3823 domain-containing protein [Pontibacter sp. 172403-2]|uniref:DUF3823 domain-containing protein n=1 Tax=Pontibacter rufus TaxID=2791028 RepID=UPI0018AF8A6F|nr:DUF3823 domain-containing protein [Pontibacter sp. 172403-2]MBF9252828.1 DUF3823 domain-containing protein [Pontibacter sp. 172403-2]